jgi:hypothetical protein
MNTPFNGSIGSKGNKRLTCWFANMLREPRPASVNLAVLSFPPHVPKVSSGRSRTITVAYFKKRYGAGLCGVDQACVNQLAASAVRARRLLARRPNYLTELRRVHRAVLTAQPIVLVLAH